MKPDLKSVRHADQQSYLKAENWEFKGTYLHCALAYKSVLLTQSTPTWNLGENNQKKELESQDITLRNKSQWKLAVKEVDLPGDLDKVECLFYLLESERGVDRLSHLQEHRNI